MELPPLSISLLNATPSTVELPFPLSDSSSNSIITTTEVISQPPPPPPPPTTKTTTTPSVSGGLLGVNASIVLPNNDNNNDTDDDDAFTIQNYELWRLLTYGDIDNATTLLRTQGLQALQPSPELPPLSILEDVLPLALARLAAQYDEYGILGNEDKYFALAKELWNFMNDTEKNIPEMICTFLYAGLKFDQPDFTSWILSIVTRHPTVSMPALVAERNYRYNQLRHSAVYYVARCGSIELYDMLVHACSGSSPLVLESYIFDQQGPGTVAHAIATLNSTHPSLLTSAVNSSSTSSSSSTITTPNNHGTTTNNNNNNTVPTLSSLPSLQIPNTDLNPSGNSDTMLANNIVTETPDPPALYVALHARKLEFVRHVLGQLSPAYQAKVLRTTVVYGIIPADDAETAQLLYTLCSYPLAELSTTQILESSKQNKESGSVRNNNPFSVEPTYSLVDYSTLLYAFGAGSSNIANLPNTASNSIPKSSSSSSLVSSITASFASFPSNLMYQSLHLCCFVTENSAEPSGIRCNPGPALKYATWVTRLFTSSKVSLHDNLSNKDNPLTITPMINDQPLLQPLQNIRWTGLWGNTVSPTTNSSSTVPSSLNDPLSINGSPLRQKGRSRGGSSGTALTIPATNSTGLWDHWSPMHSACAANASEVVNLLVDLNKNTLLLPAQPSTLRKSSSSSSTNVATNVTLPVSDSIDFSTANPSATLSSSSTLAVTAGALFPVRVSVESSIWVRDYTTVRILAAILPPNQLEIQLYAPLRAAQIYFVRQTFVKDLCKETGLSLRAFRQTANVSYATSVTVVPAVNLPLTEESVIHKDAATNINNTYPLSSNSSYIDGTNGDIGEEGTIQEFVNGTTTVSELGSDTASLTPYRERMGSLASNSTGNARHSHHQRRRRKRTEDTINTAELDTSILHGTEGVNDRVESTVNDSRTPYARSSTDEPSRIRTETFSSHITMDGGVSHSSSRSSSPITLPKNAGLLPPSERHFTPNKEQRYRSFAVSSIMSGSSSVISKDNPVDEEKEDTEDFEMVDNTKRRSHQRPHSSSHSSSVSSYVAKQKERNGSSNKQFNNNLSAHRKEKDGKSSPNERSKDHLLVKKDIHSLSSLQSEKSISNSSSNTIDTRSSIQLPHISRENSNSKLASLVHVPPSGSPKIRSIPSDVDNGLVLENNNGSTTLTYSKPFDNNSINNALDQALGLRIRSPYNLINADTIYASDTIRNIVHPLLTPPPVANGTPTIVLPKTSSNPSDKDTATGSNALISPRTALAKSLGAEVFIVPSATVASPSIPMTGGYSSSSNVVNNEYISLGQISFLKSKPYSTSFSTVSTTEGNNQGTVILGNGHHGLTTIRSGKYGRFTAAIKEIVVSSSHPLLLHHASLKTTNAQYFSLFPGWYASLLASISTITNIYDVYGDPEYQQEIYALLPGELRAIMSMQPWLRSIGGRTGTMTNTERVVPLNTPHLDTLTLRYIPRFYGDSIVEDNMVTRIYIATELCTGGQTILDYTLHTLLTCHKDYITSSLSSEYSSSSSTTTTTTESIPSRLNTLLGLYRKVVESVYSLHTIGLSHGHVSFTNVLVTNKSSSSSSSALSIRLTDPCLTIAILTENYIHLSTLWTTISSSSSSFILHYYVWYEAYIRTVNLMNILYNEQSIIWGPETIETFQNTLGISDILTSFLDTHRTLFMNVSGSSSSSPPSLTFIEQALLPYLTIWVPSYLTSIHNTLQILTNPGTDIFSIGCILCTGLSLIQIFVQDHPRVSFDHLVTVDTGIPPSVSSLSTLTINSTVDERSSSAATASLRLGSSVASSSSFVPPLSPDNTTTTVNTFYAKLVTYLASLRTINVPSTERLRNIPFPYIDIVKGLLDYQPSARSSLREVLEIFKI